MFVLSNAYIQVFLSLSFDEDLARSEQMEKDKKFKDKKFGKKRKNTEASNQLPENDRKKSRQESISKTREEVIIFPIRITLFWIFG